MSSCLSVAVRRLVLTGVFGVMLMIAPGCGDAETAGTSATSEPSTPAVSESPATGSEPGIEMPVAATPVEPAIKADELLPLEPEKDELKFGFIKLRDCAPIVIAKEKGFFEEEGLQVEVLAQPNWKQLLDNVITGELDGAQLLSGQPIAATIGFGSRLTSLRPTRWI